MPVYLRAVTLGDVRTLESARRRMQAVDPFKVDIAIAALFMVVALSLIHI